eukprot:m.909706 g.909706  ORF g.909706 m.909706 type:complete len:289 (-) comp60108_c0_seq66:4549-5415(-)
MSGGYAVLVVGPPGSGKSTLCAGVGQLLGARAVTVNLDPANHTTNAQIDISALITVDEVMERLGLGPNGALMYCIEFLAQNMDWLHQQMRACTTKYFIIDCPGQVELYTHHSAFTQIIQVLQRDWKMQVCAVNLVDSHYCAEVSKFISVLLTSLNMMLHLATPHINVLSKIDLVESLGPLNFRLDMYTDVLDMQYFLDLLDDDPHTSRFRALNKALAELIEEFNLVCFHTLDVSDKDSVGSLLAAIDKSMGYIEIKDDVSLFDAADSAFSAMPEHQRDVHRAAEKFTS